MRRYFVLLALALALGAVGLVAGRRMRHSTAPEPAAAPTPEVAIEITITSDHRIAPAIASVPKEHRVRILVTNRDTRPATLTLMGYEDRLGVASVAPGAVWRGTFVADRPGDDFAWLLDGAPAGRLAVTGSHLVDGHR